MPLPLITSWADGQVFRGTDLNTITYASNAFAGLLAPVRCSTTGAETFTIASGSVTAITGTTVDGVSPAVNDRILVCNAPAATGAGTSGVLTTQPANGVYYVTSNTTNLSVSRVWELAATGTATPAGLGVFVQTGTTKAQTVWYVLSPAATATTVTWGTTGILWGTAPFDPRIGSAASPTPTLSIDVTLCDQYNVTALAGNTTISTTGTGVEGQRLLVKVKDNGTARTLTWSATNFTNSGVGTLPTATLAGKTHPVSLIYDAALTKWVCMASDLAGY